jgi:hypothetical protein
MRLKAPESSTTIPKVKSVLKKVFRPIFNRKMGIFLLVLVVLVFFTVGMLVGLVLSGFFGTLDNPSEKALDILHSAGISGLSSFKAKIGGILSENFKIPVNYFRGQFSNPERFDIDIDFESYQRLQYKRDQALKRGQLITAPDDYVPAVIKYNDKSVNVKLRLKGDMVDHLIGSKWSFRVKVKEEDETVLGMKVFSLQDPATRRGVNEFVHFKMLSEEGILVPRYQFVEIFINGEKKGIYALEEHFETQLIENNLAREGVIIKFNEDPSWEETFNKKDSFSSVLEMDKFRDSKYLGWFYAADIDTFKNTKIVEDPVLYPQFNRARSLLESFRIGDLETHEVFDTDKLAKYFALEALNGCGHGSRWSNVRYYYNPITSLLEPIGFDGDCWKGAEVVMNKYTLPEEEAIENYPLFFKDPILFKKYTRELEKISEKDYLDGFFSKFNEEIEKNVQIIYKDNPLFHYSEGRYYNNQVQIKNNFNEVRDVNVYFQEGSPSLITAYIGNLENFPLEIISLNYGGSVEIPLLQGERILGVRGSREIVDYNKFVFRIPSGFVWKNDFATNITLNYRLLGATEIKQEKVFPWTYIEDDFLGEEFIRGNVTDISSMDMIHVDSALGEIHFKEGLFRTNESLIIPEGYIVYLSAGTSIDLVKEAMILSYSPIQFIGEPKSPIEIISSDGTGQGITLLNAKGNSEIRYVTFGNLTSPSKNEWSLMGAINIYESPIWLDNVFITNINAEDGLNIINSDFKITNSNFENSYSDCFDSDFSRGEIIDSSFVNCGNDAIDFGGSQANVSGVKIFNIGDKAISGGEKSEIFISDVEIGGTPADRTSIAISGKDQTVMFISNAKIIHANYAFAVYQKKAEYGPAQIDASGIVLEDVDAPYIVEKDSELSLNGQVIHGEEKGVYSELYGENDG